jgi:serine/threonine protein kinase
MFSRSSAKAPGKGEAAPAAPSKSSTVVPLSHVKQLTEGKNFTFKDFDLRATVGTGTFGRVRVVKIKGSTDRTPMALKIMKKSEVIRLKQVEHIKAETAILKEVEHPFIVNLLAHFQDEKRLFLLLEFINGGELFSHLRMEGRLPDPEAQFYSSEIVLAFAYLHSKSIIYRDLKPENLLIDCDGHMKVTDFGFAKIVEDRTWTLCGTPEYLAPEIIQSKGHGKAVDWWALGILIFEMLAGYPPFYDENPFGIYQKVLAGKVDFPKHFDIKAKDLIKRLLTADKAKRFGCLRGGAEDIQKHKWYKAINWDDVLNRRTAPNYIPKVKAPDDTSMFDRYPESTEASAPPISEKDQGLFEDW